MAAPYYILTITHPNGAVSRPVHPRSFRLPPTGDNPRTLDFTITEDYDLLSDLSDSSNPLRWLATVTLQRVTNDGTQTLAKTNVVNISNTKDGEGAQALDVSCVCISARLHKTQAVDANGSLNYTIGGPVKELTAIPLVQLSGAGGISEDVLYPCYPAYGTMTNTPDPASPWLGRSLCRTTTLGEDITDVRTTPFKINDDRAIQFPAFLQIGTEIIHASQGWRDSAGQSWAGGTIKRGCLGSTAAAHLTGVTIYERTLKPVTDAKSMTLAYGGGLIPEHEYVPQLLEGRFDFIKDFNTAGYNSSSSCTYSVIDIDNASDGVTLASAISSLLRAPAASGGPGIGAGSIDVTGVDTIYLDRHVVDEGSGSVSTWDQIAELISDNWSKGMGNTRRLAFWYSAINSKYKAVSVKGTGSSAARFQHATRLTSTYSMDQLSQGIRVSYDVTQPFPLLSDTRCYHLAVGDNNNALTSGSTLASQVNYIMYQQMERALAAGWVGDATVGNNRWTTYLFDGNPATGWGMRFDEGFWTSTEDPTIILCCWCPGAGSFPVDFVELVFDVRRYIPTFFEIDVVGLDSYTPGSPPTLGNIIDLGIHYRVGALNSYAGAAGKPHHWVRNTRGGA